MTSAALLLVPRILIVRLHHQQARPDALELDDARAGQRAAVDADVVRPEPGPEAGRVQDLGIELGNLDEQPAAGLIPVEREEAVDLLHAAGAIGDRRNRLGASGRGAAAALALRAGERREKEQTESERGRETVEHAEEYQLPRNVVTKAPDPRTPDRRTANAVSPAIVPSKEPPPSRGSA